MSVVAEVASACCVVMVVFVAKTIEAKVGLVLLAIAIALVDRFVRNNPPPGTPGNTGVRELDRQD
jgi:hypothetical protein